MKIIVDSAYIELTSKCNLRCKHCYNDSGTNEYELKKEILKKLFEDLYNLNCRKVIISGGEPLCYKYLNEIVHDIENFNEKKLVTNGILLEKSHIAFIKKYFNKLQISMDGTTAKEHDFIRGERTFEKVLKNLKMLNDSDLYTLVHFVITKDNTSDLDGFISLLEKLNVKEITFALLNCIGRASENLNVDNHQYISIMEKLRKNKNSKIRINLPTIYYGDCSLIENNGEIHLNLRISFTGEVYLCQKFKGDSLYSIGNINIERLRWMLESQKMHDILNLVQIAPRFVKKCRTCSYEKLCFKPCPAEILNNNIFNYEDNLCEIRELVLKGEL